MGRRAIMRSVRSTTCTYNLDKIWNKIVLNGNQVLNGLAGANWEMLPPMKNWRGPPPSHSLQYLWCPFSLRVPLSLSQVRGWSLVSRCPSTATFEERLPPLRRPSFDTGEVPPPATSSATADDPNPGGASKTGVRLPGIAPLTSPTRFALVATPHTCRRMIHPLASGMVGDLPYPSGMRRQAVG